MLPDALAASIREACGDELLLDARRGRALISDSLRIESIAVRLKRLGFTRLIDFSGAHKRREDGRDEFALWLVLRAPAHGHIALMLKWKYLLDPRDPYAHSTLSRLWPNAGLYERELLEMLGLPFSGNENLTPLLLDERFEGHPLRSDYAPPEWPNYAEQLLARRHEEALMAGMRDEGRGMSPVGTGPALSAVGAGHAPPATEQAGYAVPESRWQGEASREGVGADSASAVPTADSINAVPTESGGAEPAATGGSQ